ncbi:MAG: S24 family peptidase [Mucinivorans sp.]
MTKQTETMTAWQRLEQVVKWAGTSTNKFALGIGLKRSENLYQIKRGAFGISKELSSLITKRYPQISRSWLITGEGQMLTGAAAAGIDPETAVPFYNIDATQIPSIDLQTIAPRFFLSVPSVTKADFAAQCSGNSMVPEIPNGSIVILKKADIDTFLPGSPYMVVTKDFTTIKILRTVASDTNKLLLVPRNTVDFDEMMLDKSKVKKLYAIKAVINVL